MNPQQEAEISRVMDELRSNKPRYEIMPRLINECGMTNYEANSVVDQAEANLNGGGNVSSYGGASQTGYGGGNSGGNAQLEGLRRQLKQKAMGKIGLGVALLIGGIILTVALYEGGYIAGLSIMVIVYGVINLIKGISLLSKLDQLR